MLLRREHRTSLTTRRRYSFLSAQKTHSFFVRSLSFVAQIRGCPLSLHSCLPFSRAIKITSLSNHKKQTNTHTNKNGGRGKRQHQHEEELEFTRRARLQEYLESGFSLSVRRFLLSLLLCLLSVRWWWWQRCTKCAFPKPMNLDATATPCASSVASPSRNELWTILFRRGVLMHTHSWRIYSWTTRKGTLFLTRRFVHDVTWE